MVGRIQFVAWVAGPVGDSPAGAGTRGYGRPGFDAHGLACEPAAWWTGSGHRRGYHSWFPRSRYAIALTRYSLRGAHSLRGLRADWTNLSLFYNDVFFPYLIGGIVPGIVAATVCYYLSVPVIRAYQKRRKGAIKAKFEALKAKAAAKAAAKQKAE